MSRSAESLGTLRIRSVLVCFISWPLLLHRHGYSSEYTLVDRTMVRAHNIGDQKEISTHVAETALPALNSHHSLLGLDDAEGEGIGETESGVLAG